MCFELNELADYDTDLGFPMNAARVMGGRVADETEPVPFICHKWRMRCGGLQKLTECLGMRGCDFSLVVGAP
jgi:hypothetical protein